MRSPITAVHVALSWLTVVPLPQPRASMDRGTGAAVMSAVPVVGVLLGAVAGGLAAALAHTDLPLALIGLLVVAVLILLTRGMHVDGLSDTVDGLGCYGPPERVAEVMRGGTAGPFGVAAVVIVLGVQAIGVAGLTSEHRWYEMAFAIALGRFAAVTGTRRGITAAHDDGFGAMVAGTQRFSIVAWTITFLAAAIVTGWLGSGSPSWHFEVAAAVQAVAVLVVVAIGGWLFIAHCVRRAGGLTGDALGAVIELTVAATLVGLLV